MFWFFFLFFSQLEEMLIHRPSGIEVGGWGLGEGHGSEQTADGDI